MPSLNVFGFKNRNFEGFFPGKEVQKAIFGPQLPEWFAPVGPMAEAFEGKACPYKPCSDYCRFSQPICLIGVTVEDVWPRIEKFVDHYLSAARLTSA